MVKLRPHMGLRVLTTIGLMVWNQKGTKGVRPWRSLLSSGLSRWTRRSDRLQFAETVEAGGFSAAAYIPAPKVHPQPNLEHEANARRSTIEVAMQHRKPAR
jgi:hypothetical protein